MSRVPHGTLEALLLLVLFAGTATAEETARPILTIRDHRFTPSELRIQANKPIVIDVQNDDPTAEEFESAELGVEKVIAAGRKSPVRIRALAPGTYKFIGEYHSDTAFGTIIAEPE